MESLCEEVKTSTTSEAGTAGELQFTSSFCWRLYNRKCFCWYLLSAGLWAHVTLNKDDSRRRALQISIFSSVKLRSVRERKSCICASLFQMSVFNHSVLKRGACSNTSGHVTWSCNAPLTKHSQQSALSGYSSESQPIFSCSPHIFLFVFVLSVWPDIQDVWIDACTFTAAVKVELVQVWVDVGATRFLSL